jgi:hypothetical protein
MKRTTNYAIAKALVRGMAALHKPVRLHHIGRAFKPRKLLALTTWGVIEIDEAARALERLVDEREQLLELVRAIPIWTHHGPRGRGDRGPCDNGCLKCRVQALDVVVARRPRGGRFL